MREFDLIETKIKTIKRVGIIVAVGLLASFSTIVSAQTSQEYFILGDPAGNMLTVMEGDTVVLHQTYDEAGVRKDYQNKSALTRFDEGLPMMRWGLRGGVNLFNSVDDAVLMGSRIYYPKLRMTLN